MGLFWFIVFYIIPLIIILGFTYLVKKDRHFARKAEVTTYLGLTLLLFSSWIPVLNAIVAISIIFVAVEKDVFDGEWNIHK